MAMNPMGNGSMRGNGMRDMERHNEGRDRGRGEQSMREGREGPFYERGRGREMDRGDRDMNMRGGQGPRRWRRGSLRAREIMTRNVRSARPTDTVQQIAQIMIDEDCGIVPVCENDGRLLGVVTDRDIVCRLVARGIDMREARARDVMTDDLECVTEDETVASVLRLMSEHQIRRIPVIARGDRLVGIIAMADIAREADVDDELQEAFEDISSERSFWSRLR